MKSFDTTQKNNLMTGIKLASELPSSKRDLRRFITVFAYEYDEDGNYKSLTNILKPKNMEENVYFELRIYELPNEYFENNWDVCDSDLINDTRIEDIKGLKNFEIKVNEYIDDISILKPEWNCDNPI